ncbi:hypothetical protein B484DRAFT_397192 [Ochromonadaceae sp. CCMP2298]|nr:hypothetical protein B484DRAFT_397192 [Ochromonadaceae sp. CCMP2298]
MNWASAVLGARLVDFSSEVAGCEAQNVLEDSPSTIWLSQKGSPQWFCISLQEPAKHRNLVVVSMHVSSDGSKFKPWDSFVVSQQARGTFLQSCSPVDASLYPFMALEVVQTFGQAGQTYMNRVFLYSDEVTASPCSVSSAGEGDGGEGLSDEDSDEEGQGQWRGQGNELHSSQPQHGATMHHLSDVSYHDYESDRRHRHTDRHADRERDGDRDSSRDTYAIAEQLQDALGLFGSPLRTVPQYAQLPHRPMHGATPDSLASGSTMASRLALLEGSVGRIERRLSGGGEQAQADASPVSITSEAPLQQPSREGKEGSPADALAGRLEQLERKLERALDSIMQRHAPQSDADTDADADADAPASASAPHREHHHREQRQEPRVSPQQTLLQVQAQRAVMRRLEGLCGRLLAKAEVEAPARGTSHSSRDSSSSRSRSRSKRRSKSRSKSRTNSRTRSRYRNGSGSESIDGSGSDDASFEANGVSDYALLRKGKRNGSPLWPQQPGEQPHLHQHQHQQPHQHRRQESAGLGADLLEKSVLLLLQRKYGAQEQAQAQPQAQPQPQRQGQEQEQGQQLVGRNLRSFLGGGGGVSTVAGSPAAAPTLPEPAAAPLTRLAPNMGAGTGAGWGAGAGAGADVGDAELLGLVRLLRLKVYQRTIREAQYEISRVHRDI